MRYDGKTIRKQQKCDQTVKPRGITRRGNGTYGEVEKIFMNA
jgi:hypothetical protein